MLKIVMRYIIEKSMSQVDFMLCDFYIDYVIVKNNNNN